MKRLPTRAAALATLAAALLATGAQAQNLVNGSLEGPISNGGPPPGWTLLAGSPDTMDANNNVGVAGLLDFGAAPSPSPNGGTWAGIGASVGFIETFGQMLTGLTVGQRYTVSWVDGNFGYATFGYVNPNAVNVLVDGTSIGTGATRSLGSDWYAESLSFVASSTSQQIAFELATSSQAYVSIDGISVVATTVPEPQSWLMLSLGLVAIGARRLRRGGRAEG